MLGFENAPSMYCVVCASAGGPVEILATFRSVERVQGGDVSRVCFAPLRFVVLGDEWRYQTPRHDAKPPAEPKRHESTPGSLGAAAFVDKTQQVRPQELWVVTIYRASFTGNGSTVMMTDLEIRKDRNPPSRISSAYAEIDVLAVETVAEVEWTNLLPNRASDDHCGTCHPIDCPATGTRWSAHAVSMLPVCRGDSGSLKRPRITRAS